MWVYRRPPPISRPPRSRWLAALDVPQPAVAEVSASVSATGVLLGTASVAVSASMGETGLHSSSGEARVVVSVNALGRNRDAPNAATSVVISASAAGRYAVRATASVAVGFTAGNGDVLVAPHVASVVISAAAALGSPQQLAQAAVSVVTSVQAAGFVSTTSSMGTGTADVVASCTASAVQLGVAASELSFTLTPSLSSLVLLGAATSSTVISVSAYGLSAGAQTTQVQTLFEVWVSAIGTRISGAERSQAPVGRTVDWKALVEGASAKVPEYEFGPAGRRRYFYQRRQ